MAGLRLLVVALLFGLVGAIAVTRPSLQHRLDPVPARLALAKTVDNPFAVDRLTLVEMENNMTLDGAMKVFQSVPRATPQLIAAVEKQLGRVGAKFLQGNADPGIDAYDTASTTLNTLNKMIEETLDKKDNETIRCFIFKFKQESEIEGSKQDIASFTSRVTAARGAILVAQGKTSTCSLKLPLMSDELLQHDSGCSAQTTAYQNQIAILTNDVNVMVKVVKMAECSKGSAASKAALLACQKQHQNQSSAGLSLLKLGGDELQKSIMQLQSPTAKSLMLNLLNTVAGVQQTPALATDGASDTGAGTSPQDAEKIESKCTFRDNPNCEALFGKFIKIAGGLIDKKKEVEIQLEQHSTACSELKTNFESTISNFQITLKDAQTDLAQATKELTDAEEQLRLERNRLKELYADFTTEIGTCRKSIGTFASEICGLRKIRTEMGKMQGGAAIFYQDCEVGEWVEDTCSKPCAGGRQKLRRNITSAPNKGAPCPVLEMEQDCNMQPCPINCNMDLWSGWSSCTAQCGGGVTERARNILVLPAHEGTPCQATTQTDACNIGACDADCVLSDWSEWSSCSKQCGTGHISASKSVMVPARGQGACPEADSVERFKKEECNPQACVRAADAPTLQCKAKLDLLLVMDGSSSLGEAGWQATVTAGSQLVRAMVGGNESAEVAAMVFTGPISWDDFHACLGGTADPKTACGIDRIQSFSDDTAGLADRIRALPHPTGTTFTSMAIQTARAMLRESRPDARSVVVLITDGDPISRDDTTEAVVELKKEARLLIVPVGHGVSMDNIRRWASKELSENIVAADTFERLAMPEIVDMVIADICSDIVRPPENATTVAIDSEKEGVGP